MKTWSLSLGLFLTLWACSPLKTIPRGQWPEIIPPPPEGLRGSFSFQLSIAHKNLAGQAIISAQDDCLRLDIPSPLGLPIMVAYLTGGQLLLALPLEARAIKGSLEGLFPLRLLQYPQGLLWGRFDPRWGRIRLVRKKADSFFLVLDSEGSTIRLAMDARGRLLWLKVYGAKEIFRSGISYEGGAIRLDYPALSLSLVLTRHSLERSFLDCHDLSFKIPPNFRISLLKEIL
ncbi:hypothetical protein [Thermosulfuriphilus sp.]